MKERKKERKTLKELEEKNTERKTTNFCPRNKMK
jgi:hypothetical protein